MNDTAPRDPIGEFEEGDLSRETHGGEAGDPATAEIEELRRGIELMNDRHLRLAAEFDNYRKRSQNQLAETAGRAQAQLVGKLIEVVDDFERVAALDSSAQVAAVLEGVRMVETKLRRLLKEAGLEELDPSGEVFDPRIMEAMVRVPTEDPAQDDIVDQVFLRGFRFGGHLVRPARVSVRKHG